VVGESAATGVADGAGWYGPLLDVLPSPLVLVEPGTGEAVFANRMAHRLAGGVFPLARGSADHAVAYGLTDASGRPLDAAEYPAARAARGERVENVQVDWPTPEGVRSLVCSAVPIDVPGTGRLIAVTFEDITELERTRRRAGALVEAGSVLAGSLDYDATLQRVADLVVPRLADWCFVELVRDGRIDRVAIAADDPALHAMATEYDRRYPLDPDSPVGSPQVIRTGEAQLVPEIGDEMLRAAAQDPEHLEILRGLGFRSSMIVPLRVGGRVIGDIAMVSAASGRRFGPDDLATAQELADRCVLYVENARLYRELELARDELEAILAAIPDAVTVQRADGRLVYANSAAVRLLGHESADSLLAVDPLSLVPSDLHGEDGAVIPLSELPGRHALAGKQPAPMIVRWRPAPGARARWSRLQAQPLRGRDGTPLAVNVIEDITELKEAETTQRLLAEAGRVLAGSLDYEETLQRVARLAVPDLADWCMVDLVENERLVRVAVGHADPADGDLADALTGARIDPRGRTGAAAAVRSGRPVLREDADFAFVADADPGGGRDGWAGVTSAVAVPMTVRGQRLGAMTFATDGTERRLEPPDVRVAEELAGRAAMAVDSARVHRQRSAIARTLQSSLLPPVLPDVPGFETGALYRAAGEGTDVGGDFYDLFSISEHDWFAVIGDVCGKGAEAAAVTALARYTIRATAVRRRSPAAILRWLNDAMRRQDLGGRFCTIACVHLDLARPAIRATVACGGHPPPLLRRAGGDVCELGAPGTLLGLVDGVQVEDRHRDLQPGDALVLYTDGVTEARAPDRVLDAGDLRAALAAAPPAPAQRIVERLAAVAVGNEGAAPRDDIAMLALRVLG
jgi:PAS domain S-box-containing protein